MHTQQLQIPETQPRPDLVSTSDGVTLRLVNEHKRVVFEFPRFADLSEMRRWLLDELWKPIRTQARRLEELNTLDEPIPYIPTKKALK